MRRALLVFILLSAGCKRADVTPAQRGKSNYTLSGCDRCHAIGGEDRTTGPNLSWIGFTRSPEWLDSFLKDPAAWKSAMPQQNLPEHVRSSIVAYLDTIEGDAYAEGKAPWDAKSDPIAKGRSIFQTVGCVGCHGKDGVGGMPNNNVPGGLVPPLNAVKDGFSKAELIERIRKGVAHPQKADPKGETPMLSMPAWGLKLDQGELDALAAYLFSLEGPKSESW